MTETVSSRALVARRAAVGTRTEVPTGRCPRCGVPQGPFAERRGQVVTCVACGARFRDDGTLLY